MSLSDDNKNFGPVEIGEGWLDLRLGNPLFLKGYWDKNYSFNDPASPYNENLKYLSYTPIPNLTEQIKILHDFCKNIKSINSDNFVIGNGANHLLLAAMLSLKDKGLTGVYAPRPYWPRFKNLAEIAGLKWSTNYNQDTDILLITTPNNPDGLSYSDKFDPKSWGATIADLNYNWPHYTDNLYESDQNISIFGISKLTGHASNRVGWAHVISKDIFDSMRQYVELTTSGVSIDSQEKAANILSYINFDISESIQDKSIENIFTYGHRVLSDRWKKIIEACDTSRFTPKSSNGMFLYGIDNDDIMNKIKVLGVSGKACGDDTPNMIRINIGCDDETFEEFITRFKKEMLK